MYHLPRQNLLVLPVVDDAGRLVGVVTVFRRSSLSSNWSLKEREITVVYTWRGANKRLISARRASTNERKFYWQKARPDESEEAG